jgi:hypothetical protein
MGVHLFSAQCDRPSCSGLIHIHALVPIGLDAQTRNTIPTAWVADAISCSFPHTVNGALAQLVPWSSHAVLFE